MDTDIINALNCKNHNKRPPIWIMRQAGRYMPEYRALRKRYSLLELFYNPELAAEVTMLPMKAFSPDAAILFSDILVIVEALGLGLEFQEKIGPVIHRPLRSSSAIVSLSKDSLEDSLSFVYKTIELLRPQLDVPLLGFTGAPFTLASYMIEGKGSKDLKHTRQLAYKEPEAFHRLLDNLTDHIINHLKRQITAGVEAVQVFDSWANHLSPELFREFVSPYLARIVSAIKETGTPIILFCRGTAIFMEELIALEPSAISVDWSCDLKKLREICPPHIAIQGNMDPYILYASQERIETEITRILRIMEGHPGFVFNLGHGVTPDIPYENVRFLIDSIKGHIPKKILVHN